MGPMLLQYTVELLVKSSIPTFFFYYSDNSGFKREDCKRHQPFFSQETAEHDIPSNIGHRLAAQ
jgi:hypothetical protein